MHPNFADNQNRLRMYEKLIITKYIIYVDYLKKIFSLLFLNPLNSISISLLFFILSGQCNNSKSF